MEVQAVLVPDEVRRLLHLRKPCLKRRTPRLDRVSTESGSDLVGDQGATFLNDS